MVWWRRRTRRDPVTADPRICTDDDAFVALVTTELSRLGCSVQRIDAREAVVSGRMRGTVGLLNIQQMCTPLPRLAWPSVIAEHLRGLAHAADLRLDLSRLDPLRSLLRTRLYDEAGEEAGLLAGRLVAPGLYEALVVDQPNALHGVPAQTAAAWGEPLEDLLALGRAQVLDAGMLTRQTVDLGSTGALLLEDASAYTSGHLYWLRTYVDVPTQGALVIVPTRHCVVAHPLVKREPAMAAAQALLVNAQRLYELGPGGLSPHLYWWRDMVPTLLPGTVEPGRVELRPPVDFVEMLDLLPS